MSELLKEQFSQVGEILSCKRSPLRGRALSDREADRQSQKLFTNVNDRKLRRYTYIPLALTKAFHFTFSQNIFFKIL